MSRIVAYACSTRPNALWSAAQFDNAAQKNRTECDIPLVALSDLEAERQRADSLKALCDEMATALEPFARLEIPKRPQGNAGAYSIRHTDIEAAIRAVSKAKEAE